MDVEPQKPAEETAPSEVAPTKKCVACKSDIPVDATKCRYCSEPQQWGWDSFGKYTLPVISILVSLIASSVAIYIAVHAKDSEIASTVHDLKLRDYGP